LKNYEDIYFKNFINRYHIFNKKLKISKIIKFFLKLYYKKSFKKYKDKEKYKFSLNIKKFLIFKHLYEKLFIIILNNNNFIKLQKKIFNENNKSIKKK